MIDVVAEVKKELMALRELGQPIPDRAFELADIQPDAEQAYKAGVSIGGIADICIDLAELELAELEGGQGNDTSRN